MMQNKSSSLLLLLAFLYVMQSCSPKDISTKYYFQHEKQLDSIESTFKALYLQQPVAIGFTDRKFRTVSVDFITDTLTYIYEFGLHESRLADTLSRFNLDAAACIELIRQMKNIRCAWVSKVDIYADEKKQSLIYLSIKPVVLQSLFSYKKYYILTYYQQRQYFDEEGRLLDKRRLRRVRKINGDIFRRINDKVSYTISGKFR